MVNVRALIRVIEHDSPHVIGTFAVDLHDRLYPRAGEYLMVGSYMGRVQDVAWTYSGLGELESVDLVMPVQRSFVDDVDTLADLRLNGFYPLNSDGERIDWDVKVQSMRTGTMEIDQTL